MAIKYGNLSDEVTVTEDAVITESGATLCGIQSGRRKLTLEQLLYGLILPSGNDAAGSYRGSYGVEALKRFADMNECQEARRLGATGTHFVNPQWTSLTRTIILQHMICI